MYSKVHLNVLRNLRKEKKEIFHMKETTYIPTGPTVTVTPPFFKNWTLKQIHLHH